MIFEYYPFSHFFPSKKKKKRRERKSKRCVVFFFVVVDNNDDADEALERRQGKRVDSIYQFDLVRFVRDQSVRGSSFC